MLNYTNFWPAVGLTIGVGLLVTAALCLLVATFSPGWFRLRRRRQPAVAPAQPAVAPAQPAVALAQPAVALAQHDVTPAEPARHEYRNHRGHQDHGDPKAA